MVLCDTCIDSLVQKYWRVKDDAGNGETACWVQKRWKADILEHLVEVAIP